jgi:hypothetical protein
MGNGSASSTSPTFRETQHFALWVYPLLGVILAFFWYLAMSVPASIRLVFLIVAVGFTLFSLFIVSGTLRMTTEVLNGHIHVRYGFVPYFHKVISLHRVERIDIVDVQPGAYAGGWVKYSDNREGLLYAGSHRGVRLRLTGDQILIVSTRDPKRLSEAIRQAMPGVKPATPN